MAEVAVFLDRDGTVMEDVGYLDNPDRVAIFEEAIEAISALREAGFKIVIVTNQSGLARGLFTEKTLNDIHDTLRAAFQHQGAPLDGIYYCPHHPQAQVARFRRHCNCRKPEPGLLRRAAEQLEIDLGRSYMIGDKVADVIAGHRAGCRSVLVRTGEGERALERLEKGQVKTPEPSSSSSSNSGSKRRSPEEPDYVASNVLQAAEWILEDRRRRKGDNG
ncbi:MAG TPA: D-glycero-beta-D-manno-heptose 1,7-bisphosphate 7-phosphatase [Acidobacteriota bacterium]|nr:D-glycero-beta-D-manno-heptose 1,7-bisphosphate 7-phosphatase [Acidobacteriota bacterium]